jgi:hypothetical protein
VFRIDEQSFVGVFGAAWAHRVPVKAVLGFITRGLDARYLADGPGDVPFLHVDPAELAAFLYPQTRRAMVYKEAAERLRTNRTAISDLVAGGYQKTISTTVPVGPIHEHVINSSSSAFAVGSVLQELTEISDRSAGPFAIHLTGRESHSVEDLEKRAKFYRRRVQAVI